MQWAQGVPRDLSTTIAFEITGLSTQLYLQRYVEVKPIRGKQTKKKTRNWLKFQWAVLLNWANPEPGWRRVMWVSSRKERGKFSVLLTIVGSRVTRQKTSIRMPNLDKFTPLLRSVNQTSIGGTVNTDATFVTVISNIARGKLPPANKDWKEEKIWHFNKQVSHVIFRTSWDTLGKVPFC